MERGEFKYIGARGASVIDYVIGNAEARNVIEKMRVEETLITCTCSGIENEKRAKND